MRRFATWRLAWTPASVRPATRTRARSPDCTKSGLQTSLHRDRPLLPGPPVKAAAVVLQLHAVIALQACLPPLPGGPVCAAESPCRDSGPRHPVCRHSFSPAASTQPRPGATGARPTPDRPSPPRRPGGDPNGLCGCSRRGGRHTWGRSRRTACTRSACSSAG